MRSAVTTNRVLVLGAYGLIGAEVTQTLVEKGYVVQAAGRNAQAAARRLPAVPFTKIDVAQLTQPGDWHRHLQGIDCVVNCAGALQDGGGTDLEALHHHALAALGQAAADQDVRMVQISAIGADLDNPVPFLSSKARGDAALLASGAKAVIFRPGLVLAQGAYGGTGLIRLLAAVPVLQPLALPAARMQCVAAHDVAAAVALAVAGGLPGGARFDLVEHTPHSLKQIVAGHRLAMGFAPASAEWIAPEWMLGPIGWMADKLGVLGWRSPLRSTAAQVLHQDLTGDPQPWTAHQPPLPALPQILQRLHLGPEHRLQARMALMMPLCVTILVLFWLASGLFGLVSLPLAAAHLEAQGWGSGLARTSVIFWSFVDIGLAVALIWRPWAQKACLGMIAVCAIYLGLGSLVAPDMWLDPLGPMVKIGPAIGLALVTWALLEER